MKANLYRLLFLIVLMLSKALSAQESGGNMMNELSQANYSICYAKINEIDSIPFLLVDDVATNLISEELVFALDLNIDLAIEEIEEETFIETSYNNNLVYINNVDYNELMIIPLYSISQQMGIEFYGIISKK
jgi:hypothetical protein